MHKRMKSLMINPILLCCVCGCVSNEQPDNSTPPPTKETASIDFSQPEKLREWGFYFANQSDAQALQIADSFKFNFGTAFRGDAFFIKGLYAINKRELSWALQQLDSSLKYNPMNADVHMERGILLYDLDAVESSILAFNKVMDMDRQNPEVYYWLGQCFLKKRDTASAKDFIIEATRLEPTNSGYRNLLNRLNQ